MDPLTSSSSGTVPAVNRRRFLGSSLAAGAALITGTSLRTRAQESSTPAARSPHRYRIGICDWMILQRQKIRALQMSAEFGADGVEVDMGSLGQRETFENALANPETRKAFLDEARKLNIEICSLAMSGFYAQNFATRPTVPRMIQDCIDTMTAMNVRVAFLPLGVTNDPARHPELRSAVVERLKTFGPIAERAGVILGVETELEAAEQVKFLDEIGSPAVRSYFNFSNALQNKRDLIAELRTLGRERICQIHCTNQDGFLLKDDPAIDMPKVKETLDDMGWKGWLVIERSRKAGEGGNVRANFSANAAYLKSEFQS